MRVPSVIALLALVLTATACGGNGEESIMHKDELVVAVRSDLPSVGFRKPDGSFEGFDVDVATYLAGKLGKKIRFIPVLAAQREPVLLKRRADLVLATYSISQDRKTKVGFAGPYHLSYQDILVRTGEQAIGNVRDLKGRRICEVKGSNAAQRVLDERGVAAEVVQVPDYAGCITMLKDGRIDAITTNDVVLAGLAKKGGVRLVGTPFNEQRTGVGIQKGDLDGCEAVNRAITDMYQDGTAGRLLRRWFGTSGIDLSRIAVPQFEGCG
jgi:glutamate transport system substrate-binding protein